MDLYLRCMQREPSARPTSSELVTLLEGMQPLPHEGPRRVQTAPADATSGLVSVSAISQQRATVDMPGFLPGVGARPSPIHELGPSAHGGLPNQAPGASESTGQSGVAAVSGTSTAGRLSRDSEEGTTTVTPSVVSQDTGVESGVSSGDRGVLTAGRPYPFQASEVQGMSDVGTRSPGTGSQASRKMPSAAASEVEMIPSPFQAMGGAGGASWGASPSTAGPGDSSGVSSAAGYPASPFDNSGAWAVGDGASPTGNPVPSEGPAGAVGVRVSPKHSGSASLPKPSPPTPVALRSPYANLADEDW